MPEPSHRYFAVFERPYSSPERPESLVRQRAEGVLEEAEILTEAGAWRPTPLLEEIFLGLTHDEVVPLVRPQAQAFVDAWRATSRLASAPPDLAGAPALDP